MTSVPLHPALVHVPLALAFLLPVLTLGFTWALWKDRIGGRTWLTIVLLQAVLLGAGLVALKTGQDEEERVETVVPEAAIQTHEARAEQFLWITGATLWPGGPRNRLLYQSKETFVLDSARDMTLNVQRDYRGENWVVVRAGGVFAFAVARESGNP